MIIPGGYDPLDRGAHRLWSPHDEMDRLHHFHRQRITRMHRKHRLHPCRSPGRLAIQPIAQRVHKCNFPHRFRSARNSCSIGLSGDNDHFSTAQQQA